MEEEDNTVFNTSVLSQSYVRGIGRITGRSNSSVFDFQIAPEILEDRDRTWNSLFEKYTADTGSDDIELDIHTFQPVKDDVDSYPSVRDAPIRKCPAQVQFWVDTGLPPIKALEEEDYYSEEGSSLIESELAEPILSPTMVNVQNESTNSYHVQNRTPCATATNHEDYYSEKSSSMSTGLFEKSVSSSMLKNAQNELGMNKRNPEIASSCSSVDTAAYILSNTNTTKKADTIAIMQGAKVVNMESNKKMSRYNPRVMSPVKVSEIRDTESQELVQSTSFGADDNNDQPRNVSPTVVSGECESELLSKEIGHKKMKLASPHKSNLNRENNKLEVPVKNAHLYLSDPQIISQSKLSAATDNITDSKRPYNGCFQSMSHKKMSDSVLKNSQAHQDDNLENVFHMRKSPVPGSCIESQRSDSSSISRCENSCSPTNSIFTHSSQLVPNRRKLYTSRNSPVDIISPCHRSFHSFTFQPSCKHPALEESETEKLSPHKYPTKVKARKKVRRKNELLEAVLETSQENNENLSLESIEKDSNNYYNNSQDSINHSMKCLEFSPSKSNNVLNLKIDSITNSFQNHKVEGIITKDSPDKLDGGTKCRIPLTNSSSLPHTKVTSETTRKLISEAERIENSNVESSSLSVSDVSEVINSEALASLKKTSRHISATPNPVNRLQQLPLEVSKRISSSGDNGSIFNTLDESICETKKSRAERILLAKKNLYSTELGSSSSSTSSHPFETLEADGSDSEQSTIMLSKCLKIPKSNEMEKQSATQSKKKMDKKTDINLHQEYRVSNCESHNMDSSLNRSSYSRKLSDSEQSTVTYKPLEKTKNNWKPATIGGDSKNLYPIVVLERLRLDSGTRSPLKIEKAQKTAMSYVTERSLEKSLETAVPQELALSDNYHSPNQTDKTSETLEVGGRSKTMGLTEMLDELSVVEDPLYTPSKLCGQRRKTDLGFRDPFVKTRSLKAGKRDRITLFKTKLSVTSSDEDESSEESIVHAPNEALKKVCALDNSSRKLQLFNEFCHVTIGSRTFKNSNDASDLLNFERLSCVTNQDSSTQQQEDMNLPCSGREASSTKLMKNMEMNIRNTKMKHETETHKFKGKVCKPYKAGNQNVTQYFLRSRRRNKLERVMRMKNVKMNLPNSDEENHLMQFMTYMKLKRTTHINSQGHSAIGSNDEKLNETNEDSQMEDNDQDRMIDMDNMSLSTRFLDSNVSREINSSNADAEELIEERKSVRLSRSMNNTESMENMKTPKMEEIVRSVRTPRNAIKQNVIESSSPKTFLRNRDTVDSTNVIKNEKTKNDLTAVEESTYQWQPVFNVPYSDEEDELTKLIKDTKMKKKSDKKCTEASKDSISKDKDRVPTIDMNNVSSPTFHDSNILRETNSDSCEAEELVEEIRKSLRSSKSMSNAKSKEDMKSPNLKGRVRSPRRFIKQSVVQSSPTKSTLRSRGRDNLKKVIETKKIEERPMALQDSTIFDIPCSDEDSDLTKLINCMKIKKLEHNVQSPSPVCSKGKKSTNPEDLFMIDEDNIPSSTTFHDTNLPGESNSSNPSTVLIEKTRSVQSSGTMRNTKLKKKMKTPKSEGRVRTKNVVQSSTSKSFLESESRDNLKFAAETNEENFIDEDEIVIRSFNETVERVSEDLLGNIDELEVTPTHPDLRLHNSKPEYGARFSNMKGKSTEQDSNSKVQRVPAPEGEVNGSEKSPESSEESECDSLLPSTMGKATDPYSKLNVEKREPREKLKPLKKSPQNSKKLSTNRPKTNRHTTLRAVPKSPKIHSFTSSDEDSVDNLFHTSRRKTVINQSSILKKTSVPGLLESDSCKIVSGKDSNLLDSSGEFREYSITGRHKYSLLVHGSLDQPVKDSVFVFSSNVLQNATKTNEETTNNTSISTAENAFGTMTKIFNEHKNSNSAERKNTIIFQTKKNFDSDSDDVLVFKTVTDTTRTNNDKTIRNKVNNSMLKNNIRSSTTISNGHTNNRAEAKIGKKLFRTKMDDSDSDDF